MSSRRYVLLGVADDGVFNRLKAEIEGLPNVEVIRGLSIGDLDGVSLAVFPTGVRYSGVPVSDVPAIVKRHLEGDKTIDQRFDGSVLPSTILPSRQKRVVLERVGVIDPESIDEYIESGGYEALKKALKEMSPADVIEEVKASGLRGRGGAGFPTGLKWEFTAKSEGKMRFVIANADESEPGTFKDRVIEEGDPHRLIEGVLIAGYAVGASQGYIFIRGEHSLAIERLRKAIADARARGFIGENILGTGFSFDIKLVPSAGAYICGEETALIEALEGKRGHPRPKPPYPPQKGLRNQPTLVNNVETLANVPSIILKGADWYRSFGTESSPGTKVYSVLGNTVHTGLFEAPMGITLRELVFDYGGGLKNGEFRAALVGGAAGGFIADLDTKLDFEGVKEKGGMLGSGAVLVLSDKADAIGVLLSIARFFKRESCGKCVPCRVGTQIIMDIMTRVYNGNCNRKDLDVMLDIAHNMKLTSFCPLGQSVYLPVKTALEIFRADFESRCSD